MKIRFIVFFICFFNYAFSQEIIVSGYILDQKTGEPLIGASIFETNQKQSALTNNYGFYQIYLEQGSIQLQANYVGYSTVYLSFEATKDIQKDISMELNPLPEVVISNNIIQTKKIAVTSISGKEIIQIPQLMGEADILKSLSLMPGISGGIEGSSAIFVRGGNAGHNLMLLDGTRMYNTGHLFGFLSVFNPYTVQQVDLMKGGFSPEFGGRLSSIVDINTKSASLKEKKTEVSLGLLSTSLIHETPIIKDKLSLMVAGRSSYLGLFLLPRLAGYRKKRIDNYLNYWMYDTNAKLHYRINNHKNLYLTFYHGKDLVQSKSRIGDNGFEENPINWGNTTLSLNYTKSRKKYFNKFTAGYNHSFFHRESVFVEDADSTSNLDSHLITTSKVTDFNIKNIFQYSVSKNYQFNIGAEIIHHKVSPGFLEVIEDDRTTPSFENETFRVLESAAFLENKLTFGEVLNLSVGARYANYRTEERVYNSFEPRLKLTGYISKKDVVQISYGKMSQPLYLLTSSGGGLPNDMWLPITNILEPQFSDQYDFNYKRVFEKWNLEMDIGAFYKDMDNLITYKEGASGVFSFSEHWSNQIESDGIGRAYGLEFFLQKKTGRFTGWLGYTLLKSERKFKNVNNENWFPHKYDRRHDIELTGNYKINDKWKVHSNFVFSTGIAVTLANAVIYNPYEQLYLVFLERNGARFPDYHRLDVGFNRSSINKNGKQVELAFGVYNTYARKNPFYIRYSSITLTDRDTPPEEEERVGTVISYTLFTFLPYVKYNVKF